MSYVTYLETQLQATLTELEDLDLQMVDLRSREKDLISDLEKAREDE